MRLLLDTHVLVWWLGEDVRLSGQVHDQISDYANDTMVSSVSVWELATKQRIGKWPGVDGLVTAFELEMDRRGFAVIDLLVPHARLAGSLPGRHRDPFDRMLVAQAMVEGATLVTSDVKLAEFGGRILWAGGMH